MGVDEYVDWRTKGKCVMLTSREYDKMFFPKGGRVSNKQKEYCSDCPVIALCLAMAIEGDHDGIWAGTSKSDRIAMKVFKNSVGKPRIVRKKNIVFS